MAANVQVKFVADIADLKVQAAAASAVMKQYGKDLDAVAKQIAAGDTSEATRARLLQLTQAFTGAATEARGFTRAMKDVGAAERENDSAAKAFLATLKEQAATVGMNEHQLLAYKAQQLGVADQAKPLIAALEGQTGHLVSSRVATEGLVLVHEALRGNFTRMIGSATILGQALAGPETVSKALTAAMTPLGAVTIGTAAAVAALTVAETQYSAAQQEVLANTVGMGAVAGLTADQLRAAGAAAAEYSGLSVRASTEAASAFAAAGVRSQAVITGLAGSVKGYATLTGQEAAEAQKALAQAMSDPERAAAQLNSQLGLLDSTQLEQIRTMAAAGDKTGAAGIIMQALTQRVDAARAAGVQVNSTWSDMTAGLSNLWNWLGRVSDRFADVTEEYSAWNLLTHGYDKQKSDQAQDAQRLQLRDQQKRASAAGGAIYDSTKAGQETAQKTALAGSLKQLQDALQADIALYGAHSDAAQHDQQAITEYKRAIDTYLPSAEKAHRLAELDQQLATARRGHDQARVTNLTRQKAALDTAGEVMSPTEAAQRANDAAETAGDRTSAPKKHDNRVAEWTAQLRAEEVASTDYFSDQTAHELKFWQDRIGLVTRGSAAWIEVQGHIYEASRRLAQQAYQDQIAADNAQIEADRNNWSKQQADIRNKLNYIKAVQHEQSADYKNALREQERAQQEHDEKALSETARSIREQGDLLKKNLDDQAKVREDNAQASETSMKSNAGSTPFGDIKADIAAAQVHQQLTQQKMADNEVYHANEGLALDLAIAKAKAAGQQELAEYKALIAAKMAEDQRYLDQKRTLDAELQAKQMQDIQTLQQKYHSYIDSTVNTAVSGFDKMITGQKTFAQVGISIYQSIVREAEQQVAKMAADWIVKHLLMAAASKLLGESQASAAPATTAAVTASSKAQVLALSGVAGAAGVASMAAAPFPIDLGAPAFGAQMASTAMAMGSFAQGANVVPSDMVALIHSGERIIPAADNSKLLEMTARGAGAQSGENHYHMNYSPTVHGQLPFKEQLNQHEGHIIDMFNRAARRGAFRRN